MEFFNRLNTKVLEFKTASNNEVRRYGVYGKVAMPLIDNKEITEQFIGVHRTVEELLEESKAAGIVANYVNEYERGIDMGIKFLNRKLNDAIDTLKFQIKDQTFLLDKDRLNEIKVLVFNEDDLKKWEMLIKK